jgi:hypothetical protein
MTGTCTTVLVAGGVVRFPAVVHPVKTRIAQASNVTSFSIHHILRMPGADSSFSKHQISSSNSAIARAGLQRNLKYQISMTLRAVWCLKFGASLESRRAGLVLGAFVALAANIPRRHHLFA